jgi:hypothetical protein
MLLGDTGSVEGALSQALVADLVAGLKEGSVASSRSAFSIQRMDDGTVLEIDVGDPDIVYVVTIASVPRLM